MDKSSELIQEITLTGKEINTVLVNMEKSIKNISTIISESSGLMETRKHYFFEKKNNYLFIVIFVALVFYLGGFVINNIYLNQRINHLETVILAK